MSYAVRLYCTVFLLMAAMLWVVWTVIRPQAEEDPAPPAVPALVVDPPAIDHGDVHAGLATAPVTKQDAGNISPRDPDAALEDGTYDTIVRMSVLPGMRFGLPRFRVEPGVTVRLIFTNDDGMVHNFLLVERGRRLDILRMSLKLTIESKYIPDTPWILAATPLIQPHEIRTLDFTAPSEPGIYPYICTYPGHGAIMYGAMYVGDMEMPPLERDRNIPPLSRIKGGDGVEEIRLNTGATGAPIISRMFLPDSGPASIAVGSPQGLHYCWDAGTCRLRYAWSGDFLDNGPHWAGNGDAFARVLGRIWYRAGEEYPLRFPDIEALPGRDLKTQFKGYRLIDGYPEFAYLHHGIEVRELIRPSGDRLVQHFTFPRGRPAMEYRPGSPAELTVLPPGEESPPVLLIDDPDTPLVLELIAEPGALPRASFLMNDIPWPGGFSRTNLPVPGISGRALPFRGRTLATGVMLEDLEETGSVSTWFRLDAVIEEDPRIIIGAHGNSGVLQALCVVRQDGGPLMLSLLEGSDTGGSVQWESEEVRTLPDPDAWHHLAMTFTHGWITIYLDGEAVSGGVQATGLLEGQVQAGGIGTYFPLMGLMDELHLYDRLLSTDEIRTLHAVLAEGGPG